MKKNRASVEGRVRRKAGRPEATGIGALLRLALPEFIALVGLVAVVAEPSKELRPQKSSELFTITNIWSAHFTFTPEQWEAMEPKGGRGLFGGPGGPGGGRVPFAGPNVLRGPGGPAGFGPGMFIAPSFLKHGDQNQDAKLSQEEFRALGEKWFAAWDKEKSGHLNDDQLRAGLNSVLALPNFGPPGMGGPGGRGPGLNLLGMEGRRNGLASAMGTEFKYVHADLEFEGQMYKDVAVRYKGNGTWMQSQGSLKHSLKVDLNEFVKNQKLAGVAKINFHNNVTDASWMNEVLAHRLFRDAGVPAPRTAYARVFVTVPGKHDKQFLGLYSLVENIDNHFAEERFGTKKGAILKPVTPELFKYLGDAWSRYKQTYDPKTDLSEKEIRRVIEFAKLLTNATDADFAAQVGDYLDLDEFARFLAVTVWLSNLDSILGIGQNYYIYLHPKTGKLQFMPWDLDHSFGQFFLMGSQEQRENLSILRPWQGENRFLERVFKVESFKKLYLARMNEFSKTIFRPERFPKQVDELAAAIRPSVQEESKTKLARFDNVVAGEPVEPAGFGALPGGPGPGPGGPGRGPGFGGFAGFMPPAKPIKAFVKARAASVLDQLAGKSEGQRLGGFGLGIPFGGRGGPGRPPEFGPGMFLGGAFMAALDTDKNGQITHDEFTQGFAKWFEAWNTDKSGALTEEQLRAGLNLDLTPFPGGPPGVPGFRPPDGLPPRE